MSERQKIAREMGSVSRYAENLLTDNSIKMLGEAWMLVTFLSQASPFRAGKVSFAYHVYIS